MTTFEFWFNVDKRSNCWLWMRATNTDGYGLLGINGKMILAHRHAWTLTYGEIPEGLYVLHDCDNPLCVRPDHLFLGTHSDNMKDCVAKGRFTPAKIAARNRANRTHCPHGHEFTPDNTYNRPSGGRTCRTCMKEYKRKYIHTRSTKKGNN